MQKRPLAILAGCAVPALMVLAGPALAGADRIWFGGDIVTMDHANLFVEAVAIEEGRIIGVGRLADIEALADAETERIDLQGRTMLPGFIDPHSHFLWAGTTSLYEVNLNSPPLGGVTDMDGLVARLSEWAEANPDAPAIVGNSYDDTLLAEMRHPTRADLDRVSTTRPVIITHISGHVRAVNSAALAAAGIDAQTANPDGGRIGKDGDGQPNGVLEGGASALVTGLLPKQSEAQQLAAVRAASEMWLAAGFTTATDNIRDPAVVDLYLKALESGDLRLRLEYWPRTLTIEAARAFPAVRSGTDLTGGRNMITQGPMKLGIDGSPQGYTAHFTEPYTTQRPQDDGQYRGFSYWDDRDAFFRYVAQLHRDGWQMTTHANGDAGIQDAIDAYAAAMRAYPRPDARHTIQHAQFTRPDQLDQMAALGINPSFFIGHTFYWGDRHRDIFFGPSRASQISPMKAAMDRGLIVTTHTDSPIVPIDGIQMIWSSVNRMTTGGQVLGPDLRVTPLQALEAITSNAAWQYFQEDLKGSITPGKLADFVILSDNPLAVGFLDPMKLKDIRIMETIVGGESRFVGETVSIVARHFAD
ncbi:amidohydrolase [Paracoccus sp. (in: a-proteobacteria)]|uniref:amidohydrolase n=1 Tax=Paracoccus sp. TaxID=267 RepID=UPI00321FFC7C